MQRAIVSFSISPLNKDLIAISSSDGNIACWRISDEQIICKGSLSYSVSIAWDPFNTNSCAILSHTNIRLLLWYEYFS
jgi:WD40 repeat protein